MMNRSKRGPTFAGNRLSRRRLLTAGSAAGLALAAMRRRSFAAGSENVLKIGFISPRSGALAGFGQTDGYVLEVVRKALAKGLRLGGKTYEIRILDQDSQSDPSRASQLARTLINGEGIDLMLTTSAPETVNPVSDACEAAGVPCLSTMVPWQAWYFGRGAKPDAPSPFKWTYHFGFGVGEFGKAYTSQWKLLSTNRKVGLLYPDDADGNAVRANLAPLLEKEGYTLVDPGAYQDGTTDFSAQLGIYKREKCEIFNCFPLPPDFAVFWRQAAQQGYTRIAKIAQIAKTGLFPDGIEALGPLGYNLASTAVWHKSFPYRSSLAGISAVDLADGYERASGKQWTQQLGVTLSLLDAGFAALESSSNPNERDAVAKSLRSLKVTTIGGLVDFNQGPVPNVSPGDLLGTQWIKAPKDSKFKVDYVITEHATDPNVPIGGQLQPYNS